MDTRRRLGRTCAAALGAAVIALAGCAGILDIKRVELFLSGGEEVPQVMTAATGNGTIFVAEDRGVSGFVTVTGLAPVAAHIHTGARGKNGGIAIALVKDTGDRWVVPAGARFSDAQYRAFLAGDTYVNFHTRAHMGGEIRAQLLP